MKFIFKGTEPPTPPSELWVVYYSEGLFFPTYYLNKGYDQYDLYLVAGGGGGGSAGANPFKTTTGPGGGGGGGGAAFFKKGLLLAGVDVGAFVGVGAGGAGGAFGVDPDTGSPGVNYQGQTGDPTSFMGMAAYGGCGGGGGGREWEPAPGASGGAGGGGIAGDGRGHWFGDSRPSGGPGVGGGGDGADATLPGEGDPVVPGDNGVRFGENVFGGGGGGAGGITPSVGEYALEHKSHHGTAGGNGYNTVGAPETLFGILDPTFVSSAGGGGGGGIDIGALTDQRSLIPLGFPEPGRGGTGGIGRNTNVFTHQPAIYPDSAGKNGNKGIAVIRIYV